MTNTNRNLTLSDDGATASWSDSTTLRLDYNDTLTVALSGANWPSDAKVKEVRFFGVTSADQKDPNNPRGVWLRASPTVQPSNGEVTIATSGSGVKITNQDTTTDLDKIYYEIDVHSDTGRNDHHDWPPDPELILKKATDDTGAAGGMGAP